MNPVDDLVDQLELTLTASGYVKGEWSAREVAVVLVTELGLPAVVTALAELQDRVYLLENRGEYIEHPSV